MSTSTADRCAPCRSASHVAYPPRLKPAKAHSPTVRSSFGNKYAGRMSMRNERSFTAPAAQEPKRFSALFPILNQRIGTWTGFPHLSCRYCAASQRTEISKPIGKKRIAHSQISDLRVGQTPPTLVLTHGVCYALPAHDSIPGSRSCPLSFDHDPADPAVSIP